METSPRKIGKINYILNVEVWIALLFLMCLNDHICNASFALYYNYMINMYPHVLLLIFVLFDIKKAYDA
jgi:hypothetical protein